MWSNSGLYYFTLLSLKNLQCQIAASLPSTIMIMPIPTNQKQNWSTSFFFLIELMKQAFDSTPSNEDSKSEELPSED